MRSAEDASAVPEAGTGGAGPTPRARWRSVAGLPGWSGRTTLAGLLVYVVLAVLLLETSGTLDLYEASLVLVYAIAAVGQDWLVGRAGQISLGAAAFLAIGAYATAQSAGHSWAPFPVPLIVAAAFGGAIGVIVGISGLRFKGLYLALSTLALQFIVAYAVQQDQGLNLAGFVVPEPHLWGIVFSAGRSFDLLLLVILGALMLVMNGMYRRAPGRAWSAIRQNEEAAAVAGVNVVRWKLVAFTGSSMVTAVAGGLLAYQQGRVTYQPFTLDLAVSVLVMVFVGGVGSLWGVVAGATLVMLLPYWLQNLTGALSNVGSISSWLVTNQSEVASAVYGLALVLVLLYERRGLAGLVRRVALLARRLILRLREAGARHG
jgi:branched-chain amino acid transport system permease protein